MIDQHHLLECILWPNGDGSFRKIINRAKRLEELCIYDDYKLTIPIERRAHQSMHRDFEKGTEYEMVGVKHPMYGRTGDKAPMYGRTEDKHPSWKDDSRAGIHTKYLRALKDFKNNIISEETFQSYRDDWNEYKREHKRINGR